ncbi:hypothetical protein B9Z19DRAFT_822506 [Tuber borchii]|uniref:Secreted protein n=1 Tax=Tuber borchii TaxID=42251 RepID=A0A2T7A7A2_TUBBO|nr:hypothetical protein B9Z19DRAFT_822506 [Tuber borchii]
MGRFLFLFLLCNCHFICFCWIPRRGDISVKFTYVPSHPQFISVHHVRFESVGLGHSESCHFPFLSSSSPSSLSFIFHLSVDLFALKKSFLIFIGSTWVGEAFLSYFSTFLLLLSYLTACLPI